MAQPSLCSHRGRRCRPKGTGLNGGGPGAAEAPHSEGVMEASLSAYANRMQSSPGPTSPTAVFLQPRLRCHGYPHCQSDGLLPPRPGGRLTPLDSCRVILLLKESHRPTLPHIGPPRRAP